MCRNDVHRRQGTAVVDHSAGGVHVEMRLTRDYDTECGPVHLLCSTFGVYGVLKGFLMGCAYEETTASMVAAEKKGKIRVRYGKDCIRHIFFVAARRLDTHAFETVILKECRHFTFRVRERKYYLISCCSRGIESS